MGKLDDIAGKRFGRLVPLALIERALRSTGHAEWFCECDCGGFTVARANSLKTGHVSSCGCLFKEQLTRRNKLNSKHGMTNTPEFRAWDNMRDRCFNPANQNYFRYGGRGIRVCCEWLGDDGFKRFLQHVGLRPSPGHSIDRIDNDGNYEPGNVRWATRSEQARNRRERARDELGRFS